MDLSKLYDKYNILTDAKSKVTEHINDYNDAIDATKGGEKEKKLSTQIISKFFIHFPTLQNKALNAILDLCEDENSSIRMCAIKALPLMCKNSQVHLSKIVYVLAQLLQLEDQEYNTASASLKMIYKENCNEVIKSLFLFIQNCNEAHLREKCISFIIKTLMMTPVNGNTTETEDIIIEELKKLLKFASPEEFYIIMPFLTSSKYGKSISGANQLLEAISEQLEMDQDFDPSEQEAIVRLVAFVKFALPLFSSKCESNKFVIYICDRILPQWTALKELENSSVLQLQILRLLAELTINCGQLDNPSSHVVNIFSLLKDYMPSPSETDDGELPPLDFTAVECLLFAFHRLARQCPDFLTHNPDALKDFRARLLLFSRGVQGCKKVLVNTISNKTVIQKKDQEKMKVAPCLLENIKALIKDLFYQPPVYKVSVILSFMNKNLKTTTTTTTEPVKTPVDVPHKRHVPITFDDDRKTKQFRSNRGENQKLYQPPSGKFSNNSNFQSYDRPGRGRGGYRGRSRGRGYWRN